MPRKPYIPRPRIDLWTPEEDQVLMDAQGKLTIQELAALLPRRDNDGVRKRCERLGFDWKRRASSPTEREGMWSEAEIRILQDAKGLLSIYELFLLLPQRTKASIRNKLTLLGLGFRATWERHPSYKVKQTIRSPYKPPTTTRKCLTCGTQFESWGPGNRLCQAHKYGDGAQY